MKKYKKFKQKEMNKIKIILKKKREELIINFKKILKLIIKIYKTIF